MSKVSLFFEPVFYFYHPVCHIHSILIILQGNSIIQGGMPPNPSHLMIGTLGPVIEMESENLNLFLGSGSRIALQSAWTIGEVIIVWDIFLTFSVFVFIPGLFTS